MVGKPAGNARARFLFADTKYSVFNKVILKKLRGYVFFIYFCGTCEACRTKSLIINIILHETL